MQLVFNVHILFLFQFPFSVSIVLIITCLAALTAMGYEKFSESNYFRQVTLGMVVNKLHYLILASFSVSDEEVSCISYRPETWQKIRIESINRGQINFSYDYQFANFKQKMP